MPFDVAAVRARFGALDGSFAFFDAPGGTQVPDEVGAAVAATMRTASGNTGAVYPASKAVEAVAEEARQLAARFAGSSPDEIIFGANMTTLNFALSRTAGRAWRAGDEILVTRLDHDANVAPWLDLAEDKDLVVRHVDVLPDSSLDMADLRRKLTDRTRVVAFPWAANSLGTVTDARLIAELAHEAGAIAWADAVQYAPHFPMDLPATGVDVVLFSAYKFCGPHLGIAYGRRELLESWIPYKARPAPVSPVGARFQTGSLPIETLGGFSATMRYLDSIGGLPAIVEWERQLAERFLAGLPAGTVLYGRQGLDDRVPIFLLNLPGVPAGDVPVRLAEQGIGVWSGANFYSLGLYERLNWGEAVRVGIAHYNTLDEVDQLTAALTALCGPRRLSAGDRFPIELLPRELSGPAVVYFYPKDDTETCTRQAIEFSRQAPLFEAGGVDLFGVSVDSAASHEEFAAKHDLRFTLLSDEDQRLTQAAGVLKDYGEYGELAGRVTFLLDKSGQVSHVWEVEDVAANVAEALAAGKRLAGGQRPVVRTAVPASQLAPGVTAADLLGDAHGCHGLHQRRLNLAEGASLKATAAGQGEAWYVIDGAGHVSAGPDQSAVLRPGTAVWLPGSAAYHCDAQAGLDILAVTVRAGSPADPALHAVTLDECVPERTGDREFRVLLSDGLTITAFAGRIPPGRAPEHQHTYDEVVHVLAGHGVVHLAAGDSEIGPGTSIYLPPGEPHCLENTGTEMLEVLGVFHPAGSPAAKRET
ncbi:MAG TPA: aminotransferase class V-fold PLP-dependent enzyme [Streptosporangiaceae bacterium]|nr:aminotransferase class V-fold PLP-dependent enzyme [Streptosporangiaceae bacterium]